MCFLLEMMSNIAYKLEDREDFSHQKHNKVACTVLLKLAKDKPADELQVINLG